MLLASLAAASCRSDPRSGSASSSLARDPGWRVRVLGTAQDGGLPHAACRCPHCEAARRDPARRRLVACLAAIEPSRGHRWLVDATPDLREQLDALRDVGAEAEERTDRAPVDGVLLTHAHIGHYTGLMFFGFEAVSTHDLPVVCTPRMAAFLRDNGPWSQLVRLRNIAIRELAPGGTVAIGDGLEVTSFAVPHRDEYSDTVGLVLRGTRGALLYVPDTDSWRTWSRPLPDLLRGVDVALLDGTFFSVDELPGRPVTRIGHPLIRETMDLLEPIVRSGRTRVFFTHLNHSNGAVVPGGPERAEIERRGFRVLEDGAEFPI